MELKTKFDIKSASADEYFAEQIFYRRYNWAVVKVLYKKVCKDIRKNHKENNGIVSISKTFGFGTNYIGILMSDVWINTDNKITNKKFRLGYNTNLKLEEQNNVYKYLIGKKRFSNIENNQMQLYLEIYTVFERIRALRRMLVNIDKQIENKKLSQDELNKKLDDKKKYEDELSKNEQEYSKPILYKNKEYMPSDLYKVIERNIETNVWKSGEDEIQIIQKHILHNNLYVKSWVLEKFGQAKLIFDKFKFEDIQMLVKNQNELNDFQRSLDYMQYRINTAIQLNRIKELEK